MRRYVNKYQKDLKVSKSSLNKDILQSKEFKALQNMNAIMHLYDGIESLGYDSLHGEEEYLSARFSAHAFMQYLLSKIEEKVKDGQTTS